MSTKKKRAARQVWCAVNERGVAVGVYPTRKAAKLGAAVGIAPLDVVGPYVLAERVGQR